ncbi:hypothetical protein BW723_01145 [Polaribacter reichenbachii]|uniref:Outer membrane protein beta-barrel domain-containing protein n=1 Tax=Polaribacter reichenbachii TaxID=996801 RepID=A0A1B8TS65_9FLAO|nr:outer membrane beta-barrel protein [Polaribacter reichenbachii]APZ44978.1 hypothetical protein BW723_01145 [Polaribacter reichenbachii]AUC18841.1 hypothetical protein BTO17_09150 [Polaribacter reichenbachii]OBY62328.1 hypothetical protein LPB301_14545 [Polaribacter reichenbachii]
MKKLLLITLLIANTIYAQEKKEKVNILKNTWLIGGKISLSSTNAETTDNNTSKGYGISLNPEIGFTIKNNLVLGLGLGYDYYKNENTDALNYSRSRNVLSIAPYVKKFIPINSHLLFSLKGEARFSTDENKNSDSTNLSRNKTFFVGFRPGITYFLSKRISLDANIGSIGYSHFNRKYDTNDETYKSNSFNLNLNSSDFLFGFTYYL